MEWRNKRPSASPIYVNAAPQELHSEGKKNEGNFPVKSYKI